MILKLTSRLKYTLLTVCILLMIATIYLCTTAGSITTVLSQNGLSPYFRGNTDAQEMAIALHLTRPDGLDSTLSALERSRISATFFVSGSFAQAYPDAIASIVQGGHEIGCFPMDYVALSHRNKAQCLEQIERGKQSVESVSGRSVSLFSPPYASYDRIVLGCAQDLDLQTVLWSIDLMDADSKAAEISQRMTQQPFGGAILRGYPSEALAAALPMAVEELRQQGYSFTTVGKLLS